MTQRGPIEAVHPRVVIVVRVDAPHVLDYQAESDGLWAYLAASGGYLMPRIYPHPSKRFLDFIDEHILWIPSGKAVQPELLSDGRNAMAWLFGSATITYRDRQVKNVGYGPQSTEWIQTDQADIFPGRTFTEAEHDAAALVAVVNAKLATELFGDSDPIGKEIDLDAGLIARPRHKTGTRLRLPISAPLKEVLDRIVGAQRKRSTRSKM